MCVHCTHFVHVMKSKTLFNIHLKMTEQTRDFQTIRFSVDYEYAWVGEFFKASSFVKVSYNLCNHRSVGYISMLCIQVHWQFLIASSAFRLVNILLQKFDISSEKEMKMIKTQIFQYKTTTKCHKSKRYRENIGEKKFSVEHALW